MRERRYGTTFGWKRKRQCDKSNAATTRPCAISRGRQGSLSQVNDSMGLSPGWLRAVFRDTWFGAPYRLSRLFAPIYGLGAGNEDRIGKKFEGFRRRCRGRQRLFDLVSLPTVWAHGETDNTLAFIRPFGAELVFDGTLNAWSHGACRAFTNPDCCFIRVFARRNPAVASVAVGMVSVGVPRFGQSAGSAAIAAADEDACNRRGCGHN